ncbi:MAG: redoxin domain-containing protein [Proteobacteria bacterium]|nr:redoxin domain-containing protein [Pseudomonadota bacterium]
MFSALAKAFGQISDPAFRRVFALSLVALTGCEAMMMRHITSRLKKNPAPDFELTALDGETVRLSELRGKPVLLSFWAFG